MAVNVHSLDKNMLEINFKINFSALFCHLSLLKYKKQQTRNLQ